MTTVAEMGAGGLYFEGVDRRQATVSRPTGILYLETLQARLIQGNPGLDGAFHDLDVDHLDNWAVVAGPVDDASDGFPGVAVHVFRLVGSSWVPVSGGSGTHSPSWTRRSSGPALSLQAGGESGISYLVLDAREDVASLVLDAAHRTRDVDLSGGAGLVAVLYEPGDGTTIVARNAAGAVLESYAADEFG